MNIACTNFSRHARRRNLRARLCYLSRAVRVLIPTLILIMIGLSPGTVPAAQDLYTGEAVVEPGRAADAPAFRAALGEVLVKLTGQQALASDPALMAAAGAPESLQVGYQFREHSLPMRDDDALKERRLVVEFDPDSINDLLADRQIPRWGVERPDILIWTVFETRDGRVEFGESESGWLEPHLEEVGRRRGLSLISPLYDGMDRSLASTEDIRGGFSEQLVDSLPRYGADALVLVDFREMDPGWVSSWVIRLGRQEERFVLRDDDPEPMLAEGISKLADFLARRFATVRMADPSRQQLTVSGVRGPAHFAEVLRYLNGLSLVDAVHIRRARDDRLEFELELNSSGLEDVLGLGDLLEYQGTDAVGGLSYRLQW